MGGAEQHVIAPAVLQPKQVLPVLGPAIGGLIGVAGQQGGESHLLGPGDLHLLPENSLDLLHHFQAERQPRVHPRCDATDVARPDQPPMAGDLGICRVFTQGPNEQLAEASYHRGSFLSGTEELYRPVAPRAGHAPGQRPRRHVSSEPSTTIRPPGNPIARRAGWRGY